jgi:hypothetical protein
MQEFQVIESGKDYEVRSIQDEPVQSTRYHCASSCLEPEDNSESGKSNRLQAYRMSMV